MARSNDSLWTDVEALHRLARTERKFSGSAETFRASRGLPPDAFPPFPHRSEFAVHSVEAPMTLASGDFCDTFLLAPSTLCVVVADVSGKGVAAAMVRGVARSVIRNIAPVCPSPGELLTRLDRILNEAELGSMYLTLFVAWYDTRTGEVRFANAGHPIPYRITARGEVEPFGVVTGPILGILGHRTYDDALGRLEPGERLVLYTDGITDAANGDDEPFGALRLTHLLAEHAAAPIERLCRDVVERVRRFEGRTRQDDVSLVVVERRR